MKRLAPIAGALLATAGIAAIPVGAMAGTSGASTTCSDAEAMCFAVAVAPASAVAGDSTTFAFTFYNESRDKDDVASDSIASVTISAPSTAAGFVIAGASAPAGASVSISSNTAVVGSLSIAPWQSATIDVTATVPCGGGAYTWPVPVVQNSSSKGFTYDPSSSNDTTLSGTISGSCSLAFSSEPNSATVGSNITSVLGNPSGSPVAVEVLDGDGNLATAQTGPVTVTLSNDPGGVSFSPVTVGAVGGIATFSNDLAVNTAAIGYQFAANSPDIVGTTSSYFDILNSLQSCSTSSCSTSGSGKDTSFSANTSDATGDYLGVGFGGIPSFQCGSYVGIPLSDTADIASYMVFTSTGGAASGTVSEVTEVINKQTVLSSGHPGASSWQICYGSTAPDSNYVNGTTSTTTIGGETYYFGLLPVCSSTVSAPCIVSRHKDNAGNEIIQFQATDSVWRP